MSRCRKIWFIVLSLCMFFSAAPLESSAAQGDSYTYTLTFYAGNQGEFSGIGDLSGLSSGYMITSSQDRITISGLSYRDRVSFNAVSLIKLPEDSKYYVKGIRQSGRDNNTVDQVRSNSILVESDRDYVVAYGIKGDMVAYHVNYRDEAGNTLAPSETYYGNVGDKPVMAFLYIEGYEPQAYNLTRTLVSDESKNEFNFVYRRAAAGANTATVTGGGNTSTAVPGSVTVISGEGNASGGNGTGTGGGANANANADTDGEAAEGENAENAEAETTTIQDDPVPQAPGELVDLDDEEVPLANLKELIINSEGRFVYGASILIGVSAAAALIGMGIMFWKKKHVNEEIDNWEIN